MQSVSQSGSIPAWHTPGQISLTSGFTPVIKNIAMIESAMKMYEDL